MIEIKKTETYIEHDILCDGEVIGTVELCPERNEIARLNISDKYQNSGYGTQVVKMLIQEGYTTLQVRPDNKRAIHVYEKCGFVMADPCFYNMKFSGKLEDKE